MLLPYKVKNPVKNLPIATLAMIAVNVIVYMATTNGLIEIRDDVVGSYAFTLGNSPFITIFTAFFLHADIFHIAGNMLFLWIFGPPVEDRLGIPKFLGIYFVTGIVGSLLQAAIDGMFSGVMHPIIGASGCIMGIIGAYWYIFPWSTVCVFYWIFWFWHGVWEISAAWVIGIYMLMNLFDGLFAGTTGNGGVANFAHIGGAVAGALICLAIHAKKDTAAMSDAKAIQAETKNLYNTPLYALQTMIAEDPGNPDVLRAMLAPSIKFNQQPALDEAMSKAGPVMINKDPRLVASYLLDFNGRKEIYQPMHLLRLGGLLERAGEHGSAVNIYRLISDHYGESPEAETALFRAASCLWNAYKDAAGARYYLGELSQRFPHGQTAPFAATLQKQMS